MNFHETSLSDARDYCWNFLGDRQKEIQWSKYTVIQKMARWVSDCVLWIFDRLLLGDKWNAKPRVNQNTPFQYKNGEARPLNSDKDIICVLEGDPMLCLSQEEVDQIEKDSNCKVGLYRVQSDADIKAICAQLDNTKNRIQAIWIRAHGWPDTIHFQGDMSLSHCMLKSNSRDPWQLDLQKDFQNLTNRLAPNGVIILESCSTGKDVENVDSEEPRQNIAQFFAKAAPGHKVYAPTREAIIDRHNVTYNNDKGGFQCQFKGFANSTYFAKGSFLARLAAIWHAARNHRVDITREFLVC